MATIPFDTAANSPSPSIKEGVLVISSDLDRTLQDFDKLNFELLSFLSDARRAGHRVIIVSRSSEEEINDSLYVIGRLARKKINNLVDMADFEAVSKPTLVTSKLATDLSFDDETIAGQSFNYATPKLEIRVNKDFSTSPFTIDELREKYDIPKAGNTPLPTPPTP